MSLSTLLNDTSVLLNDMNYSFQSKVQLTRWINSARSETARRTACIRRLITGQSAFGASAQPGQAIVGGMQPGALPDPMTAAASAAGAINNGCMTIPGVERYPYQGFFNVFLKAQYAGCEFILDTFTCAVNWGGTTRPVLNWMPWDNFQAYCRSYSVLNQSWPVAWSVFDDGPNGEIWLFPVPSQATEIELDVSVSPSGIYSDDDYDAIPHGFQEALKYGAAKLSYLSSSRYAQAQAMEDQFADSLGITRVSVDRGKVPAYYGGR